MTTKLHAGHIEMALARHYGHRENIIVPNVHWGLGLHYECDLLVVTKAGNAHEIEIKVSKSDIKAEQKKTGFPHRSTRIKKFSFAVPDYLKDCEYLPMDCGLITIDSDLRCRVVRPSAS